MCCNIYCAYIFTVWIKVGCNINHSYCIDNTCKTDLECERVVTYTNGVRTFDDQFCILDSISLKGDTAVKHFDGTSTSILGRYCCRTTICNKNDTLLENFIRSQLGMCLHWVLVCI